MKFRLIVFLVSVFYWGSADAQQQVKVKVFNQYEAPVDEFSVNGKEYEAGKDGFASIDPIAIGFAGTDSVSFTAKDYKETKVAVSDLTEGVTISMNKNFTWKDLLTPMFYIKYGGLWLLLFIVFAETGLLFGFFFPGDSLLFVAGIYSGNLAHEFLKLIGLGGVQNEWFDLLILCALISTAGILGNMAGYWTGKKVGHAMYSWKDNFIFKQRYLHEAHDFYEKHGGGAIVFARFLPFIRTFAPIIAGIVEMDKKKFMYYNIVGCVAWVITMIFAGHFLQIWVKNQFGIELKDKLELIVIIIIAVTTAPVIWQFIFGKKAQKPKSKSES